MKSDTIVKSNLRRETLYDVHDDGILIFSQALQKERGGVSRGLVRLFCLSLLSRVIPIKLLFIPPLKGCPRDSFDEAVVSIKRLLCVGASS